jgi:hypothetical protein
MPIKFGISVGDPARAFTFCGNAFRWHVQKCEGLFAYGLLALMVRTRTALTGIKKRMNVEMTVNTGEAPLSMSDRWWAHCYSEGGHAWRRISSPLHLHGRNLFEILQPNLTGQ